MTYNLFAISAISSECEHNFNKTSYTIATQRNSLNREIIKVEKVLQL